MRYDLTIGTRKYEFLQMKFKREASLKSQSCELLIIPATGAPLPTFGDVISIVKEVNNVTMTKWQGKVNAIQYIPLQNNVIKVIGYDLARKINYVKVANLGYANAKGSTIVSTEISPIATTDLTAGTIDTTDAVIDTVNLGKSLSGSSDSALTRESALEMAAMISDRDVYIKRDGSVDFSGSGGAGVNRSSTHQLIHGLNCWLLPDIGYNEDETRRVKQVIVKGHGVGTNYKVGSAGVPSATDKIRQVELPFLHSSASCASVAQSILSELDQMYKYTKLNLAPDLFQTNYDVYDTLNLKSRLPGKNVNENLKIFSIETKVSSGENDISELVTLELANFRRSVWAKMANPTTTFEEQTSRLAFSTTSTQAQINIIPSLITEQQGITSPAILDSSEADIFVSATFSSTLKTVGAYVLVDLKITTLEESTTGVLEFRFTDGTSFFPSGSLRIRKSYNPNVGAQTHSSFTFFLPVDVAGKTITMKGAVDTDGRVEVIPRVFIYSVGA